MTPEETTPCSGAVAPPVGEEAPSPPAADAPPDDGAPAEPAGETPPAGEPTDWTIVGPVEQRMRKLYDDGKHPTIKKIRQTSEQRKVANENLTAQLQSLQSAHTRVTKYADELYTARLEGMTPEEKTAFENAAKLALQGPPPTAPAPPQATPQEDVLEPTLREILKAHGYEWGDSRIDVGESGDDPKQRIASVTSQALEIKKVSEGLPAQPPPERHPTDPTGGGGAPRGGRLTLAMLSKMSVEEIQKQDQKEVDRVLELAAK